MITILASCSFREVNRRPKLKSWFHRDPYKVRFLYQQIHKSLRTCSNSLSYTACTLSAHLVFSYQQRFATLHRRDFNAWYDWRRYSLRKGRSQDKWCRRWFLHHVLSTFLFKSLANRYRRHRWNLRFCKKKLDIRHLKLVLLH